jgi:hypothetical protein
MLKNNLRQGTKKSTILDSCVIPARRGAAAKTSDRPPICR